MSQLKTICLSLEELAVSLSLLGKPEVGKGLLISELGQIGPEEERGRLSAATHTLMAKELLSFHEDQLQPSVSFVNLVTPLVNCDFSFRCSRTRENASEQVLIFYFRQGHIVRHEIRHSVIHYLTKIDDIDQVVKETDLFFELSGAKPFSTTTGRLTQLQLEEVRHSANASINIAKEYLSQQGISGEFNQLFAEDLHTPEYRGSALRVETSLDNQLISNAGFMLLHGNSGRLWFLEIVIDTDVSYVSISPASILEITNAIHRLLIEKSF